LQYIARQRPFSILLSGSSKKNHHVAGDAGWFFAHFEKTQGCLQKLQVDFWQKKPSRLWRQPRMSRKNQYILTKISRILPKALEVFNNFLMIKSILEEFSQKIMNFPKQLKEFNKTLIITSLW